MHNKGIKLGIDNNWPNEDIARKVYVTYPTFAFEQNYELEFEILNTISNEFGIPITAVQIAGSAKTGHSYYKGTQFERKKSDLDIAIIDPILFQKYAEIVLKVTRGMTDLSGFGRNEGGSNSIAYNTNMAKGFFRPDLMPVCDAKRMWFNFFNRLSAKYSDRFKDINAGIYLSLIFFEFKQAKNIDFIRKKV